MVKLLGFAQKSWGWWCAMCTAGDNATTVKQGKVKTLK